MRSSPTCNNRSPPQNVILHAETICVCAAFIFVVGLLQITISLGLRFFQNGALQWYLYPEWAASPTVIPFLFALVHCANKRNCYVVITCVSFFTSFFAASSYIVLVIVNLFSSGLDENARPTSFLLHYRMLMIQSTKEPTIWDTLPFLVLILAVVQALLSFAGSLLCFMWSQCCARSFENNNKLFYGMRYNAHGGQASPLLTIRKRPNYCSETMRSHIVPASTLHRPNFINGISSPTNGNVYMTNGALKGTGIDDTSDLYMARSILRRQNMIDEV